MSFRVQPNGSIETDTLEEALALAAKMKGAEIERTCLECSSKYASSKHDGICDPCHDRVGAELDAKEAAAAAVKGAWDPPSGTWYFQCGCPGYRKQNSEISATIAGARCSKCGVCADRPPPMGTFGMVEENFGGAFAGRMPLVATIEQPPPAKNVSLDPKPVPECTEEARGLWYSKAALARVDRLADHAVRYAVYVEEPIGVTHAHVAPFGDYDEGCSGCLDEKAIAARATRQAKLAATYAGSPDSDSPIYDSSPDAGGHYFSDDCVLRLAKLGGLEHGKVQTWEIVDAIERRLLTLERDLALDEARIAEFESSRRENVVRASKGPLASLTVGADAVREQIGNSRKRIAESLRRGGNVDLKAVTAWENGPRVGFIGEERHVTGTDCCKAEECECGGRLHRGQAPGAQSVTLCEDCEPNDVWVTPTLPTPDASAAPGSKEWWAAFHKANGRDPTAAEMSAAARTKGSIPESNRSAIFTCGECGCGTVAPGVCGACYDNGGKKPDPTFVCKPKGVIGTHPGTGGGIFNGARRSYPGSGHDGDGFE